MSEYKITLKSARVKAGLSAEEACKELGISRTTLWSIEQGKTKPSVHLIKKMLTLYDVPIDFLKY